MRTNGALLKMDTYQKVIDVLHLIDTEIDKR